MTTSEELFNRILEILEYPENQPEVQNRLLHEALVIACHEGLKSTKHGFGNLSSQVDSLCHRHKISPQDIVAIHLMRRHSNSIAPILPEDLAYDCRALAIFVSAVFNESIPSRLTLKLPRIGRRTANIQISNYRYIRCTVRSWDSSTINVSVLNQDSSEEELVVDYTDTPEYIDLTYIRPILRQGMQLNLLDCNVTRKRVVPRIIVVEPDFLLDISSIANCFEDYGHHPLSFMVNRMQTRTNSRHILLGNFAGAALDDIINNDDYSIADTFNANFRDKALDFATCPGFNGDAFKQDAQLQVSNIEEIVADIFKTYNKEKAILEPSFVCEQLGIQGRVDLMTTDFKLLVEQKSGKNYNIERKWRNRHGSLHVEKHYVQVLLYFGILQYNFRLSGKNTDIRLLYSKYPLPDGLLEVEPLQKLMMEAIKFRNQVVATEYWIADNDFARLIPQLTPKTLQVTKDNDKFFKDWILPRLTETLAPLHRLSPLEKAYYCRMTRFVIKEQIISKVGVQEGTGSSNADLWNMPLAGKIETGNIYVGLTITRKEQSKSFNGYDTITLNVPEQGDDFLPNFRRGDMVYLYSYKKGEEPDVRRSILFKGSLVEIRSRELIVHLNDGQQNPEIISGGLFAIERSGSDITTSSAINGLHGFITANEDRKQLLLGQRIPTKDETRQLSREYNETHDNIILKAKQANDYFLLIGPPGTGKTSMALQYLVRELIIDPSSSSSEQGGVALLLSYTNRAVDEICGMLSDNSINYIRMGNEFSCDQRFKDHLLSHAIEENPTLESIRKTLDETKIIVSTTSYLASHPFIFNIKHFDIAIIDEASQILEPNIIGILSAHINGTQCIDKFILIGDHKQLPAVVQQDQEEAAINEPILKNIQLDSCANSLFERLIRTERAAGRTDFIGTLRKQGRMHPDIAAFPNEKFYFREQLECVPLKHQTEENLSYNAPSEDAMEDFLKAHRMIFIPSKFCKKPAVSEKVNTDEAKIVSDIIRRLHRQMRESFNPQKSIGVIVPYRNQIAMIRKELEKLNIPELEQISIDTVERFQGSQRDVIIYSFTIQNHFQLEFLTANTFIEDGKEIDRKLNVAITRARKQLILTGNEPTLRQNGLFAELIDFITERGGKASYAMQYV
ncbi:DEAD/DEAH box helicase [Prevotella sp. HUN102]|uniref:DEAD/DEAH box helicase n=1 Tax=Prevotella sp. HUN102 TaxID=1392486 RepID=UPI00048D92E0|nr:AAA domain-containing protein [Prevotella sp. HUN102]